MTNQEVIDYYNKLQEHYGDKLANPEQEPRRFEWQVRIYRYYQERNNATYNPTS